MSHAAVSVVMAQALFRSFICRACGLIYDEAKGDPDSGLAPGTRFDDIPDDWACPLCGVTKADFEPHELATVQRRPTLARVGTHANVRSRNDADVVIVGAGRAGWEIARTLRERDADLSITMVAACDASVYDKPLLSVALARGTALSALVKEAGAAAAQRLNVRLLVHTSAVSVSAPTNTLRTTRRTSRCTNHARWGGRYRTGSRHGRAWLSRRPIVRLLPVPTPYRTSR